MKKYNSRLANKIIDLIRADTYTVFEICQIVKISKTTLYRWQSEYPDFSQAIKDAKAERMQIMVREAKKSLMKKLQGYEITETRTVTIPGKDTKDADGNPVPGKPRIKEHITTKKHIAADTAAIIFTLTNGDPENWSNRQRTEITGKDGTDLFAHMTDEDLNKTILELQRKLT